MTGQAKSGELGLLGPFPLRSIPLLSVTPALVAGIYAFLRGRRQKSWMAGTSLAMTPNKWLNIPDYDGSTRRPFSRILRSNIAFAPSPPPPSFPPPPPPLHPTAPLPPF